MNADFVCPISANQRDLRETFKAKINYHMAHNNRRDFLRKFSGASIAALALPSLASANSFQHSKAPAAERDESYWELVKRQFALQDKIMVNAANLCPAPHMINDQVLAFQQGLAADVSFQYRAQFAELRMKTVAGLSEFVGVMPAELGITRNTSESNCILVNGLDFKPGDEIVLWDQNHPSNKESWINRAKRTGTVVKMVTTPAAPKSTSELVDVFAKAMTSKTRLLSFSHISNVSGVALPAKEICAMAKGKGAMTLVDGAQSMGFLSLDLHDMGCDFYTSSTHKWLMGPLENGILYVNQAQIDKVWPGVIGAGWHDNTKTVDEKLCIVGQRNETTLAALRQVTLFHSTIGKDDIQKRVQFLATHLKQEMSSVDGVSIVTPMDPQLSGGVLVIQIAGKEAQAVYQLLYSKYKIAAAAVGGVRFSPHIYNTVSDANFVIDAVKEIARS
jgi:isopenicillin-N epimerase